MKKRLTIINLLILFCTGILNADAQFYGKYTLMAVQNATTATLIDSSSNVFHTWTFASTSKTGYSSYLQHDTLIRTVAYSGSTSPFSGGGITGEVQKVAWDGTVIWDYVYASSTYCMHHDVHPMPNGNVLIISYELKTAAQVTAAGSSTSHAMWPDKIIEVQPTGATTGTIVWEWHAWDHLVQNVNANDSNYYSSIVDHPELLNINYNNTSQTTDWMHTNGVDYNPDLDQIAISSHNLNEIYIIDHSTTTAQAASHSGGNSGKGGDILYRWGNPTAYGATGTADFNVVHDAHWVKDGCPHAGYLVGFNNNGVSQQKSSIDLINPPLNGYNYTLTLGSAYGPTTFTIRDTCSGHASDMGNSQQLPNGNTLICIATSGKVYEIDSNKNIIWTKTVNGTVPKAFRYTACDIFGAQLATPAVTVTTDTLNAGSAYSYQWYDNGTAISGATGQQYIASDTGHYSVSVSDSLGCSTASSSAYTVTIPNPTAVSNITGNDKFEVYPNPSTGIINISTSGTAYTVAVYNAVGSKIAEVRNSKTINLSAYSNGVYYLVVKTDSGKTINNKVVLMR